jgi:hypothetical protein
MYRPSTYLAVTYFPTYLPIYGTYYLQNWLPRWNQILSQLTFIHNWVLMGIMKLGDMSKSIISFLIFTFSPKITYSFRSWILCHLEQCLHLDELFDQLWWLWRISCIWIFETTTPNLLSFVKMSILRNLWLPFLFKVVILFNLWSW